MIIPRFRKGDIIQYAINGNTNLPYRMEILDVIYDWYNVQYIDINTDTLVNTAVDINDTDCHYELHPLCSSKVWRLLNE